jgi:hypothetical protein
MAAATAELRAFVPDGPSHVVIAPSCDLPRRLQSLPTPPNCSQPQAPPAPPIPAATGAELPELDGAQIATAGMHHRERGTIPHLLASHNRAEVAPR